MSPTSREEKIFDEACKALRKLRYNLAFDLFTEVMEILPENPEIYYNRGLSAGHLLKWEEAELNFSMALRLMREPDYYLHRALARLHLRRWEEALEDLNSVLELERENEFARIQHRDLVRFLDRPGKDPSDVPPGCREWFDERLLEFVGVDPEIVTKSDRAGLREFIARELGEEGPAGCDHTYTITEEWALKTHREPLGVCRFLFERGMHCDCQVLAEASLEGRN